MSLSDIDYYLLNYGTSPEPQSLEARAGRTLEEASSRINQELFQNNTPWSQPDILNRENYRVEDFKSNLFRSPQPTPKEKFLGNINDHNNYSAKFTPFDPENLVDSPIAEMNEFYNSIANFHTKQAPEFTLDMGGQIPPHSLFLGGNFLDVNGGGNITNVDHRMFGSPEVMVDLAFETSESLHLLDSVRDTLFPRTAWQSLERDDVIPLSNLGPEEIRTQVNNLLQLSLPSQFQTISDDLFDEIAWGTMYGNGVVLGQVYQSPTMVDKINDALDTLYVGFTEDIPNALGEFFTRAPGAIAEAGQITAMEGLPAMAAALTNMAPSLESGIEETMGTNVTLADKAVNIHEAVFTIAKYFKEFGEWWDSTTFGQEINKIASIPRKLDEGFERFNRNYASRHGRPIQGSAIVTHLSDRPVVDVAISKESIEFKMSEVITTYLPEFEELTETLNLSESLDFEGLFKEGRAKAKQGLEFVMQHGIIPSAIMAMGDQVIEAMNAGDQEESITASFRNAVTNLSHVSSLFSGIDYPWLSPTPYRSQSVKDASTELHGPPHVEERVEALEEASSGNATISTEIRHPEFDENMRRFMNFSLKDRNFETFGEAQTFILDILTNPDNYTLAEQHAYLTIWNEGFGGLKGFLDSETKDSAMQTQQGLVQDNFVALLEGRQIVAGKAGTSPFDFIWDLGNNSQNLKIYQTPGGQELWTDMRNWMQGLYEEEYRTLANVAEGDEIPPWRALPTQPHIAGQGYHYLFDDLENDPIQQTATIMTLAKLDARGGFIDDKGSPVINPILERIGSQIKAGLNEIDITNIEEKVRSGREEELLPAFTAFTTMFKLLDRTGTTEGYEQRLSLLSNSLGFTRQSLDLMAVATTYIKNRNETFNPWAISLSKDPTKIQHMADMLRDAESGTRNVFVGLSSILHGEVKLPEISPRNVNAMNDSMVPDYAFDGLSGPEQAEAYHDRMDSVPDGAVDINYEGSPIPGSRAVQALSMFHNYGVAIAAPTYQGGGGGWFWGVTGAKKEVKQKALDEYKMLYDAGLINGDYHEALRTSWGNLPHNVEEWTIENIGDWFESDYMYMLNNTLDGVRRLYNSPEGRNAVNVMKTLMGGRADLQTILHGRRLLTPDAEGGDRVIDVGNNVSHIIPYADGLNDAFYKNRHSESFNNMNTPWDLVPNKVDAESRARKHGELTTVMEVLNYKTPEDRKTEVSETMGLLGGSDIMRDLSQSGVTPTAMQNTMEQIMRDVAELSSKDPDTFKAMRGMDRGRLLVNAIHRLTKSGEYPKLTEVRGFQFKTPQGAMMFTPSDKLKEYGLIDVVVVAEPQYVETTSNRPATDARVAFKVVTRSTGGEGRDIGLNIGHLPLKWTKRLKEPKPVDPKKDWTALEHAASPNIRGMWQDIVGSD